MFIFDVETNYLLFFAIVNNHFRKSLNKTMIYLNAALPISKKKSNQEQGY